VTVTAATNVGGVGDALWVNAGAVSGTASHGGVWIDDAAATPVTVASVTAGAGPVVIGGQGNLLVGAINAGSDSATLSSAAGSVLDGVGGGSSASHPNVTAGAVTVLAAASSGDAGNALWVNAASISGTGTSGGVWINDAASTPVTVTGVSAGAGPVVIGSEGNLLIDTVTAGSGSVTLDSAGGAVLDHISGGSSAAQPNVTAGSMTVHSATDAGSAADALWVNAASITASATSGGVWINDAAVAPVTVALARTGGGPLVIDTQGTMVLGTLDAGTGAVALRSVTGSILDGIGGGSSTGNPNVTGGAVTLYVAAGTVGTIGDRVYINSASIETTAPANAQFINTPPTPYPALPLIAGVSPVTVYGANSQAQVQQPQQLPITLIGQPLRLAPPIAVTTDFLGIALPAGVDVDATQQDSTMGTASEPILGGNDDEIGRKKTRT
jgi:hypothetical protein